MVNRIFNKVVEMFSPEARMKRILQENDKLHREKGYIESTGVVVKPSTNRKKTASTNGIIKESRIQSSSDNSYTPLMSSYESSNLCSPSDVTSTSSSDSGGSCD